MMKKILTILSTLGFLVAFSTASVAGGKHPPPKGGEECSPGYYKNHTEEWFGVCCDDQTSQCDDILADLTAKGRSSGVTRAGAAAFLNGCFAPDLPCNDD